MLTATKEGNDIYRSITATATVTCAKAGQGITFNTINDQCWTNILYLSASADSGLPVSFAINSGPAAITNGNELIMTGYGIVSVIAAQAGNDNYNAAPSVTNSFNAIGPFFTLLGTNGATIANSNTTSSADGTDFGAVVGLQGFDEHVQHYQQRQHSAKH